MLEASDLVEYKIVPQDDGIDIENGPTSPRSRSKRCGILRLTLLTLLVMFLIGFCTLALIPIASSTESFLQPFKSSQPINQSTVQNPEVERVENEFTAGNGSHFVELVSPITNPFSAAVNETSTSTLEPSLVVVNISDAAVTLNPPFLESTEISQYNTTSALVPTIEQSTETNSSNLIPAVIDSSQSIGNFNIKGLIRDDHASGDQNGNSFRYQQSREKVYKEFRDFMKGKFIWIMCVTILTIISMFACLILCCIGRRRRNLYYGFKNRTDGLSDLQEADKVQLLRSYTFD